MKGNRENIYLVLEGPGKSGKDTVEPYLVEQLQKKGFEVVRTFEPGGTERGMEIRKRLFEEKRKGNLRPIDELAMLYEARDYSMNEVVIPAMASIKKTAVVGLRNFLSSKVYQEATGTPASVISEYHKKHYVERGYPVPDLTLLLLITAETAARRLGMVGSGGDAFDEQGFDFLKKISTGYGELAYQMLRRPSKIYGPVMTLENNYLPDPEMASEVIRGLQESAWRMVGNYFDLFEEDREGKEPGLVYRSVSPMERSRMRR